METSSTIESPNFQESVLPDSLLDNLRTRFRNEPSLAEKIQPLFIHKLSEERDKTVAVRSEDLVSILSYLLEGRIPVTASQKEARMSKSQGWFYLTPLEPLRKFAPDIEVLKYNKGFYEDVSKNAAIYAQQMALTNAFMRSVVPFLFPDWQSQLFSLRKTSAFLEREATRKEIPLLLEGFMTGLENELGHLEKFELSLQIIAKKGMRHNYPTLTALMQMVASENKKLQIAGFLRDVYQRRGGVIIGFNERIIQGKLIDDSSEMGKFVIHGSQEVAFKPRQKFVDLTVNPITAIEPLGEWEDHILTELGIIKA